MDLSGYSKVIYVDQVNGNDSNNGLTPQTAVATLTTAKTKITSDNTCVYVKKGIYTISDNLVNLITSYSVDYVVSEDDRGRTFIFMNTYGQTTTVISKLHRFIGFIFCIPTTRVFHYFYDGSNINLEFRNCAFDGGALENLIFTGNSSGCTVTKLDFINCSVSNICTRKNKQSPVDKGNFINCVICTPGFTPDTNNIQGVILQNYYEPYNVTWRNVGQGTNPDGSQAHLGVYGGTYAWFEFYTPPQNIKNSIEEMEIGDVIEFNYVSNKNSLGVFYRNNQNLPLLSCVNNSNPNGKFYFIKVSDDLLVADRNIQNEISFDTLRGVYNYPVYLLNIDYKSPVKSKVLNFNGQQVKLDIKSIKSSNAITVAFKAKISSSSVIPIGFYMYDIYALSSYFGFNTGNSDIYGINWTLGTEAHIIVVFKPNNYNQNKIYINGVKQTLSQKLGSINTSNCTFWDYLCINGWGSNSSYTFNGTNDTMSEVLVINGDITDDEAMNIYKFFEGQESLQSTIISKVYAYIQWMSSNFALDTTCMQSFSFSGMSVIPPNIVSSYVLDLLDGGYYLGNMYPIVYNNGLYADYNVKTAVPQNNEWDLIINNPNIDKKYFNTHFYSWCNNIQPYFPINFYAYNTNSSIASNSYSMLCRGSEDYILNLNSQLSSGARFEASGTTSILIGFRPCIRLNRGDI